MIRVWRYKRAGWFWSRVLRLLGFLAVLTPWRVVYVLPEAMAYRWLLQHETMHALQCHDLGVLRFWWRLVRGFVVMGYWLSPLEVEARAAQRMSVGVVHAR